MKLKEKLIHDLTIGHSDNDEKMNALDAYWNVKLHWTKRGYFFYLEYYFSSGERQFKEGFHDLDFASKVYEIFIKITFLL